MRLVEVARGVRHPGEIGTACTQAHRGLQPDQRGVLLGRDSDDSAKTTLECALAQADVLRQVVDSPVHRCSVQPRYRCGHERIRGRNADSGEKEIFKQRYRCRWFWASASCSWSRPNSLERSRMPVRSVVTPANSSSDRRRKELAPTGVKVANNTA